MTVPATTLTTPTTFKAYEYASYGDAADVLTINTAATHAALESTHVRIRVHSAALNPADPGLVEIYGEAVTGSTPTAEKPYRIGFDAAGTVAEVGASVHSGLQVGDAVYAMAPFTKFGTFSEFIDVDEKYVARKPKNLSFNEAASVPLVALTSYQALVQHAQLKRGERVLVLGGSSATGIFAIQLAKLFGASHVTATASSRNAAFVKSLGADEVVDYTTTKWVDAVPAHSIDVVYDCGVEPDSWNGDAQQVLRRGESGRFVTLNPVADPIPSRYGAKLVGHVVVTPSAAHLNVLTQYIEAGELKTVIDSVYPFEDLLVAIAKQKTRHAVGKLVVQVIPGGHSSG